MLLLPVLVPKGRRGGQCYYEQGSPFLSHASSRCPTGCRPKVSHTQTRVGSPKESVPPRTWTESGQTPILRKVSSSPDCWPSPPGLVDRKVSGHVTDPACHNSVGNPEYSVPMTALDQAAALVALLRERPRGMSWHELAAEAAYGGDAQALWERLTTTDALVADPRLREVLSHARADVTSWEKMGLRLVTVLDRAYPARLLDVRETPPFLFARGDLRHEDEGMSVVGSRRASDRGCQLATEAAQLLIAKGLTVIAGLAAGIDTTAHRAALDADGRTVAFIGTGITKYYPPENKALQDEIAERGLVLSQFWPDAPPTKQSFPIRNASMSGYGLATIVIEASETSGTRIQARLAVEHGRPVILMKDVVRSTKWGSALVGRPGVHVASNTEELGPIIDNVVSERDLLRRALRSLAS